MSDGYIPISDESYFRHKMAFDDSMLRDYFAAHALTGILAAGLLGRVIDLGGDVELAQKQVCAGSYTLADEMMKARSQ